MGDASMTEGTGTIGSTENSGLIDLVETLEIGAQNS